MTSVLLALSFVCGTLASCTDNYELDDEGNYPSWLGESIYDGLKNPDQQLLTGSFTNYLRLIDDLGYDETLKRTGSKTVFPANDEAFDRFYASNDWGVHCYEDLSKAQKKMLLYSSILDNAMLVEMFSNVSSGTTSVSRGVALKHVTTANVIDTITYMTGAASMPLDNDYWSPYYRNGIHIVCDGTRPMMVHFTSEQMSANNISTSGEGSDFELLTGKQYESGLAFVFNNEIIHSDVTCKNGYIQQLQDVLVPPSNLAEVIRTNGKSNILSRMLDRFSAPYFDNSTTTNYNDYAVSNNETVIDSIYQKRYFSERSQGNVALSTDPNGKVLPSDELLPYDPGWNQYTSAASGTSQTNTLADLAAFFVPTDEAMEEYFLPGGGGSFLIEQFGTLPNTADNLAKNVDQIPTSIVRTFLSNLMKTSFVQSVPSKFNNVMDDAADPMGLDIADITRRSDGTADVRIANNGVAYMMDKVYAPSQFFAVSAPALFDNSMRVINWAIQDKDVMNQNFYAYLLAMSANYALFMPDDKAFDNFYVDPVSLKNDNPRALHFYYDASRSPYIFCSTWKYDADSHEVGDSTGVTSIGNVTAQMIDILNYHTVILNSGETIGSNKYYKTKHGGEIEVKSGTVRSGAQIDNGVAPAKITRTYNEQNGCTYRIDHLIQGPLNSVYKTLSSDSRFSEFMALCSPSTSAMEFAGISSVRDATYGTSPQDKYIVFSNKNGLDYNVQYFNTYNYTVYAPNNEAMRKAFAAGLPTWEAIEEIANATYSNDAAEQAARKKVLAMIEEVNKFIRYHFQDNSIYADNTVSAGSYTTACIGDDDIYQKLTISKGSAAGQFVVTDNRGVAHIISSSDGHMVNKMTRDFEFEVSGSGKASSISTSSFAVVHEISTPLNSHTNTDRYDTAWK